MDHLKTSIERRNRWYCKSIWPRYMKVKPLASVEEWQKQEQYLRHNGDNGGGDYHYCIDNKQDNGNDSNDDGGVVYSIPFDRLRQRQNNSKFDDDDGGGGGGVPHRKRKRQPSSSSPPHQQQQHVPSVPSSSLAASVKEEIETSSSSSNITTTRVATKILQEMLKEKGFVIVSGVLNETDCQHALELAHDFINAASRAEHHIRKQQQEVVDGSSDSDSCIDNQNNSSSDTTDFHHFPTSLEGGMIPFYGSGHSTFAWYIRSHPNIKHVFQHVYSNDHFDDYDNDDTKDFVDEVGGGGGGEKVYDDNVQSNVASKSPSSAIDNDANANNGGWLASLDGVVLWPSNYQDHGDVGWFHIDQNPINKPEFTSYQGLLNLLPTTKETGGNVLVSESHKYFPQHYTQGETVGGVAGAGADEDNDDGVDVSKFYNQRLQEINGDDWLEIDPNDKVLLQPEKVVMCLLQPGDLLLWDSRLVHCSYPPLKDNDNNAHNGDEISCRKDDAGLSSLLRAATTITMMPTQLVLSTLMNAATVTNKRTSPPPQQQQDDVTTKEATIQPDNFDNHNDLDEALTAAAATTVALFRQLQEQRVQAVNSYRTLTHWVNKVKPLGEERPEQVALEEKRISAMMMMMRHNNNHNDGDPVLLNFDELNESQKRLVIGT